MTLCSFKKLQGLVQQLQSHHKSQNGLQLHKSGRLGCNYDGCPFRITFNKKQGNYEPHEPHKWTLEHNHAFASESDAETSELEGLHISL